MSPSFVVIWQGDYIELHDGGRVEYWRCCCCGRELHDPESRARGLGPTCVGRARPGVVAACRDADRRLYAKERRRGELQHGPRSMTYDELAAKLRALKAAE